jgi:hypothetical protein
MSTNLTATFPECANYTLTATKTASELHINEIMKEWNCTELEASASLDFDCETLKETQDAIAQAVTYERLIKRHLKSSEEAVIDKYFDGVKPDADAESLNKLAREEAEERAYILAYCRGIKDDYATMSEEEKEAAIFGTNGGI